METIRGQLKTPAYNNGVRKNIHLITDADSVMVDIHGETGTLADRLTDLGDGIEITSNQPTRPCVWFQVKD